MKNLLISGAIAVICFNPFTAIASTPVVRNLKQSQVSGDSATLHTINVWNGHGVSISFYQTNEIIKRVWIDDPSQILIDTDGCLEGIDSSCQRPGAGLIHLRRIKRVNIPGLPQNWATHLTIITEKPGNQRQSYHFRVVPSDSSPQYSQIAIVNESQPQPQPQVQPKLQPLLSNFNTARYVRAGMAFAVAKEWINSSDLLHKRLANFINYLTQGDEILVAADKAVVSMELINKLIEIGKNQEIITGKNYEI
ncbi:hypothetical protein IQ243_19130 [Nostocales cyanobacterium LEGE 11386]|nr:hypothetical protein [Nostocales cyanobacterium LEGE 11386]